MRKLKEGMILLNVNKIFRILLLQTENTLLPFHIKVVLKSDISSQHKINVGPLRVINTYYALDTGPITIKLLSGSQFFMEEFVIIQLLDLSGFYGHVYFIGLHFSILFILCPVEIAIIERH